MRRSRWKADTEPMKGELGRKDKQRRSRAEEEQTENRQGVDREQIRTKQ